MLGGCTACPLPRAGPGLDIFLALTPNNINWDRTWVGQHSHQAASPPSHWLIHKTCYMFPLFHHAQQEASCCQVL